MFSSIHLVPIRHQLEKSLDEKELLRIMYYKELYDDAYVDRLSLELLVHVVAGNLSASSAVFLRSRTKKNLFNLAL